eukprot:jgi/Mesvir1/7735/Mv11679-RA.1
MEQACYSRWMLPLLLAVFCSVLETSVCAGLTWKTFNPRNVNPLDEEDLVNEAARDLLPGKYAYASMVYGGTARDFEFFTATRVMFQSLRATGTTADLVVMASDNVPQKWIDIFESDGLIVRVFPNAPNPYASLNNFQPRFLYAMNKIWAWKMTEYRRVVMLDADNLFLRNIDELFHCGEFCAVFVNPCIFHTGLVVLEPSNDTLTDMLDKLDELPSYDGGDQGFLNSYYEDLLVATAFEPGVHKNLDKGLYRLTFGYQMDAVYYYQRYKWEVPCSEKSVITFPGLAPLKPWFWWSFPLLELPYYWHEQRRELIGYRHETPAAVALAITFLTVIGVALCLACSQYPQRRRWPRCTSLLRPGMVKALAVGGFVLSAYLPFKLNPTTLHPVVGWLLFLEQMFAVLLCVYSLGGIPVAIFAPMLAVVTRLTLFALPIYASVLQKIVVAVALCFVDGAVLLWTFHKVFSAIDASYGGRSYGKLP